MSEGQGCQEDHRKETELESRGARGVSSPGWAEWPRGQGQRGQDPAARGS